MVFLLIQFSIHSNSITVTSFNCQISCLSNNCNLWGNRKMYIQREFSWKQHKHTLHIRKILILLLITTRKVNFAFSLWIFPWLMKLTEGDNCIRAKQRACESSPLMFQPKFCASNFLQCYVNKYLYVIVNYYCTTWCCLHPVLEHSKVTAICLKGCPLQSKGLCEFAFRNKRL